jgi:hypothetical protein
LLTDLAVSLDYYSALGYREVGRIGIGEGAGLTMLKFPGEQVVTLELVHRPADGPVQAGTGFSHLVPARSSILLARTARGHRGSPTLTATGSSWCSGRPGIPTGSAPPTSAKNTPRASPRRDTAHQPPESSPAPQGRRMRRVRRDEAAVRHRRCYAPVCSTSWKSRSSRCCLGEDRHLSGTLAGLGLIEPGLIGCLQAAT